MQLCVSIIHILYACFGVPNLCSFYSPVFNFSPLQYQHPPYIANNAASYLETLGSDNKYVINLFTATYVQKLSLIMYLSRFRYYNPLCSQYLTNLNNAKYPYLMIFLNNCKSLYHVFQLAIVFQCCWCPHCI